MNEKEFLLAFSCKTLELCPSCAAKRSAATAVLLAEEVLEEVAHAQRVFVIPEMLRPYFLCHRPLLGDGCRRQRFSDWILRQRTGYIPPLQENTP